MSNQDESKSRTPEKKFAWRLLHDLIEECDRCMEFGYYTERHKKHVLIHTLRSIIEDYADSPAREVVEMGTGVTIDRIKQILLEHALQRRRIMPKDKKKKHVHPPLAG